MALRGSKRAYDRDGDGRLSAGEWTDWYYGTYGHDLEMAERRRKQSCEAAIQQWEAENLSVLCQCWDGVVQAVRHLAPQDAELSVLAQKAAAYEMAAGLLAGGRWSWTISGGGETISRYAFRPFQQLVRAFLQLRSFPCAFERIDQAVCRGDVPFSGEGALQERSCGAFWRRLIEAVDPWDGEEEPPDAVGWLLQDMGTAYDRLSDGQGAGEAERLQRAFLAQWQTRSAERRRQLHTRAYGPDAAAAEEAVRRWDFSEEAEACRDLLSAAFPDAARRIPAQELLEMDASDFLYETYRRDPVLAVAMWQKLLDTAEAHLCEAEPAEWLLNDAMFYVWHGGETLVPVLQALRTQERFARQVFQSAFVGDLQEAVLAACDRAGDTALKARLTELLANNPYVLVCPHPDAARARELLQRGALQQDVDLCRVILLDAFPQLDGDAAVSWERLVRGQLDRDPQLGIAMWRTLLDAAEPCLASNREAAEELLPAHWIRWKWLRQKDEGHLVPILDALGDERFARQVFQSASVSELQQNLLRACRQLGRDAQGEALLALLRESPFPQSEWRVSLEDCEQGLRLGAVSR